jgi:hypothetical protein
LAHSPNVEGFALSAIRCKVVLANLTLGLAYATFPADFGVVKLSFKAILLGFLASVVADFAFGVVLGSVFYLVKHINFQQLNSNPSFKFVTALIGTLAGILAGYVTGRIAKQYPIYNSLALGVLVVLLGFIFWLRNPGHVNKRSGKW